MKDWVNTQSLGDGRGVMVAIGKAQIEKAGFDPDEDLENLQVNRYVFENDAKIMLRFREKPESKD
ncbi:hypothetical protein ACOJIV_22715 [Haloarcula sp. AONF1]